MVDLKKAFENVTAAFAKQISEKITPVFWDYDEDSYETIFYSDASNGYFKGFICSIYFENNTYGVTYDTEDDNIHEDAENFFEATQKAKQMIINYINNK